MPTTYLVPKGDAPSLIAKKYGTTVEALQAANPQYNQFTKNRDYIQAGWTLNIPDMSAPQRIGGEGGFTESPVQAAERMRVLEQKPIQPLPMQSLTSTGQNYLKVRQDAGLPADELAIKKLYRDRGFEESYGEWRGTDAQYKSMWLQDIQEGVNKVNDRIATAGITDDQEKVLQEPTRPGGGSISNVPTEEFKNPTGDDYKAMTDEILAKIGTTDMAKLIQDFSGGTLSTPELELSKEERDAQLEELKTAAASGLATIQKSLATRGMTFSSIRSDAEVGFAADVLSKESGINREFAGKIINAARSEQKRRETALETAETDYNSALEKMGYVYNPINNTIEKTLARENAERDKKINYPASYDEWQLAGGLEGTGMTYNQFLDRNQKDDKPLYTEKDFYAAVDKGKTDLQQGENWENVWNRVKMQFPNVSDDIIDNALGISWKSPEAYQKWAEKKKWGQEKIEFTLPDGTKVSI